MAQRKLRLMISSRCRTKFPLGDASGVELSTIRKELKKEIEAEEFFGKPLVNVWINETETEDGSHTSWEACVNQAEECDIFIALLDGEAGCPRLALHLCVSVAYPIQTLISSLILQRERRSGKRAATAAS